MMGAENPRLDRMLIEFAALPAYQWDRELPTEPVIVTAELVPRMREGWRLTLDYCDYTQHSGEGETLRAALLDFFLCQDGEDPNYAGVRALINGKMWATETRIPYS